VTLAELLEAATPGPWSVYPELSRMQVRTADGHYGIVADTIGYDLERGEQNAALIAITPDLARLALDMGEEIRQWAEPADDDCGDETCPDCAYTRRLNALLARLDGIANKDKTT
jgi:hypothetical protein